jgi:hypothetical protein
MKFLPRFLVFGTKTAATAGLLASRADREKERLRQPCPVPPRSLRDAFRLTLPGALLLDRLTQSAS